MAVCLGFLIKKLKFKFLINLFSVKVARESFMERAAKLKQAKVAETNTSEFKPIFKAKQFDGSSGSAVVQ